MRATQKNRISSPVSNRLQGTYSSLREGDDDEKG